MPHTIEQLNQRKLQVLSAVSFVLSISTALLAYVESRYLEQLIGAQWLGLGFFAAYGLTLIALDQLPTIVGSIGKTQAALLLCAAIMVSLGALASAPSSPWIGVPLLILYIVSLSLLWIVIDFFIEMYSTDAVTGTVRGRYLTIMNAGWVVTPFFAFMLFERAGFPTLFALAALLVIPVFFVFRFALAHARDHLKHPENFWATFTTILQRRELSHIFVIAFVLQFFYAWMVIYTPLHLRDIGIADHDIGRIFAIMLLPFVLLQYPAGVLADKKLGEKELLITGLLFLGGGTLAIYFTQSRDMWVWAGLLFTTRIGAALIEIMRDTYFFKQIDYRDLQLMSFYRNTGPLAYMIAPLLATGILLFTVKETLFLILGILILCTIFFAARLKDTR